MTSFNPDSFLAAERTYLAWVRTCLAVLGFGLAFSQLFPVSMYGVNMSNGIAYCAMASSIFLLIDSTVRYFIRLHDLSTGTFQADKIGPAILFISVLAIILVPATIGRRKVQKIDRRLKRTPADFKSRAAMAMVRGPQLINNNHEDDDDRDEILHKLDELIDTLKRQAEATAARNDVSENHYYNG
eukprot:m.181268 g.181268  ORF g.181268 m.181268 type:complete len:185 (-) comp15209_c0_seq1:44-598(-)